LNISLLTLRTVGRNNNSLLFTVFPLPANPTITLLLTAQQEMKDIYNHAQPHKGIQKQMTQRQRSPDKHNFR